MARRAAKQERSDGTQDKALNIGGRPPVSEKEQLHGEMNPDKGGAGAPQGGRVHGRQGDQQGIKM